jgi:TPP-dependent pyruvate/acetoin dehydrogenase alpha subunit
MSSASEAGTGPGDGAGLANAAELVRLLRAMLRIRAFEECLLRLPRPGFQLLSSGEEAVAVGVCAALRLDDQLLSSGRSVGPALARGLDPLAVMAELQGKGAGPCKGKAGRGHLAQPAAGFFGAHAVVGGNLTVAAGVALAAQMQRRGRVVACIFGDGACGAGALHETLNIAALWKLPLVFVCDNNQYSVSTPVREALAPARLADLARPFGLPAQTVDGMDVVAVRNAAQVLVERARSGGGPSFLECLAYRFTTHSTSSRESRPEDEVRLWRDRCPIRTLADRLLDTGILDAPALEALRQEAEGEAAAAAAHAAAAPYPEPSEALADVE